MNDLRAILSRVADGDLDPDSAASLIDGLPSPEAHPAAAPGGSPPLPDQPVRVVRVRADGMKLTIVGDPTVDTATASGPHEIGLVGDVLTIGTPALDGAGFQMHGDLGRTLTRWMAAPWGKRVTVRVNPSLLVDVEVNAGTFEASGLRNGLRFRVAAGTVRVVDSVGAFDGHVSTGSAEIRSVFTGAGSRVSVELGSAVLEVLPGSDVRLESSAEQGSVKVTSSSGGRAPDRVGAGSATLAVDVRLGSAKVLVP